MVDKLVNNHDYIPQNDQNVALEADTRSISTTQLTVCPLGNFIFQSRGKHQTEDISAISYWNLEEEIVILPSSPSTMNRHHSKSGHATGLKIIYILAKNIFIK